MPLSDKGYVLERNFVELDVLSAIKNELRTSSFQIRGGGIRNAEKKLVAVNSLVSSKWLIEKAANYLSGEASVVRVILFIKSPDNNYDVHLHSAGIVKLEYLNDDDITLSIFTAQHEG